MQKTKIEYCDMTFNPVTGCLQGCPYCYARGIARRFEGYDAPLGTSYTAFGGDEGWIYTLDKKLWKYRTYPETPYRKMGAPYPFGFDPTFHRYRLGEPARVRTPQTVFVCSMADLFGEWVPDEWIEEVFAACALAPQHTYLFLTKNPRRYAILWERGKLPSEHWYGVTIDGTGQGGYAPFFSVWREKKRRVFLSLEPLLAPYEFPGGAFPLILGAESGNRKGRIIPKKEWIEDIVNGIGVRNNRNEIFMKNSLIPIVGEENMRRELPWVLRKGKDAQ